MNQLASRIAPSDRHGLLLLFGTYVSLLAGRFTVDRVSGPLSVVDLRWVALSGLTLGVGAWLRATHGFSAGRAVGTRGAMAATTLWAGYTVTTACWSPPGARVAEWLTDITLMAGFLILANVICTRLSWVALTRVFGWFFVTGLVYVVGAFWAGPGDQGRYAAFGGGPNVFVRIVFLGALGAVYLAASRRKLWPLLSLPIFVLAAVLSGSRGGLAAIGCTLLVGGLPLLRHLGWRRLVGFGVAVAALGVMLADSLIAWLKTTTVAFRFLTQTVDDRYDSGRIGIFRAAVDLGTQQPLGGAGLDGFYAAAQAANEDYDYAHNLFLETFADGGAVGLVLVTVAIVLWLRNVRSRRPMLLETRIAYLAGVFFLLASQFSGRTYDSRFMWFAFIVGSALAQAGSQSVRAVVPASVEDERETSGATP